MACSRSSSSDRTRAGFTLTELLVATAVFIIGFSAAFSMFLAAIRYRTFADATARNAMAAASQIGEIYIDSGTEPGTGPMGPAAYAPNGDATYVPTGETGINTKLFTYNGIPGALGRVKASCAVGDFGNAFEGTVSADGTAPTGVYADGPYATAIQVDVVAMVSGDRQATTDYNDLNQRLRMFYPNAPQLSASSAADACDDELVKRGIASVFRAVIVRHPHWYYTKGP